MHAYFLRPGNVEQPITFSVDRIHDGRSFTTRRTQAYQEGVPILSMIASFQSEDDGLDHQVTMPEDMPDPDSLPTTADALRGSIIRLHAPGRATGHSTSDTCSRPSGCPATANARRTRPSGSRRSARCRMTASCTARRWRTSATTRCSSRSSAGTASPGRRPDSRSPVSTTRCGGTGLAGWTNGCCTCRSRRTPSAAEDSRSADFQSRRSAARERGTGGHHPRAG